MLVLHADDAFLDHDTGRGHPECKERAKVVADALARHAAVAKTVTAAPARADDVHLVHDPGYVEALRRFVAEGGGAIEADTAASAGSWTAASKAAGAVVRAVEESLGAARDAVEARSF